MGAFDNIVDKVTQLNQEHGDKIEGQSDQVIDRAAEALSNATGGKFDAQLDQAKKLADERIGTADTEGR